MSSFYVHKKLYAIKTRLILHVKITGTRPRHMGLPMHSIIKNFIKRYILLFIVIAPIYVK